MKSSWNSWRDGGGKEFCAVTWPHILLLGVAGLAAGVMNAIAGGGTIVTFPALIFAGLPSIGANATSTVALLPGTLAGVAGYRRQLPAAWKWIYRFLLVSLAGGLLGAILLTRTPQRLFDQLVPWLILFATVLFTSRNFFTRLFRLKAVRHVSWRWLIFAMLFQFVVAIYGGYFGAGIGILMLASLGLLGFENIHQMNAVKNALAFLINVVAALYFISKGMIDWSAAAIVALGAIAGGYAGAHYAQQVSDRSVRLCVTGVGLLVTAVLFYQRMRGT
jgi:uncharacterized membrane protein YfcA